MNAIVTVEHFQKNYRHVAAVSDVSLTIRRGEIHGLIGPDGAGKSSLLKAVAGVLAFDGGTIRVFDTVVDSEAAAERIKSRIGFMPQGLGQNLYPDLSVEENVDFFARLRLVPPTDLKERKELLLEMTHLAAFRDRAMKNLSGGMKQKLGLVCSLIHQPELLILDEPTTGVDPVSRRDFWVILAQLLEKYHTTAIVSTAYMDEAARFHSVSLMFDGAVLARGKPEDLQKLAPGRIATLKAAPQAKAMARLKAAFPQVQPFGLQMRVFVPENDPKQAEARVRECLSGLDIATCRISVPELEDVFVALLQDKGQRSSESPKFQDEAHEHKRRTTEGPAILAKQLVRDFGAFRAVDHLSFEVAPGEIFGLLGANGAGKSTAIKMLTGILRPSSGEGHVAGADMRTGAQTIKSHVGYMSQAFSLYEDLSARENLHLYGGIYGLSGVALKRRIQEIATLTGLEGEENELVRALPMGIRQRLALACALLHRPSVLFLDEPTSGVDPLGRRRFWEILFQLSRTEGVTILVTTHYMNEAEHCDHLLLMYAGRSVADATPADMKNALRHEAGELLELTVDEPLRALEVLIQHGFAEAAIFGNRIHLFTRSKVGTIAKVRALLHGEGLNLYEANEIPLSMEDVFVHRIMALEERAVQEKRP